jgi:hypothetical protein
VAATTTSITFPAATTDYTLISQSISGAQAGDYYRLTAWGTSLNNTGTTLTNTHKIKLGATTVLTSPAQSYVTSANTRFWRMQVDILVESLTAQRIGAGLLANAGAPTTETWQSIVGTNALVGSQTAAENLSTAKTLVYSIQASAISAATFVVIGYTFERLR